MRDQLLKAGIISEQRAAAMERLSEKKREDDRKKSEAESEIHKYKFLDEKFKKKIRIVNKNKDGVILSNGVAEMPITWKDVKESFHVVDKFFLIPNLKQQQELLDTEKKMSWFQDRFVLLMGVYSSHKTGKEPDLENIYGLGTVCTEYQEEHKSSPREFIQALKNYFQYLDQMLHYSALRWK